MGEPRECPLQFHDFRPVEHTRQCPRYTAMLSRSAEEGIGAGELDTLQLELETLLAAASRRLRVLEAETQVLTDWQDRKGDKKFGKLAEPGIGGTAGPSKLVTPSGSKPKKGKSEGKGAHGHGAGGSGHGPGRPKTKLPPPKITEYEFPEESTEAPRAPKNDTPSRFWASVEPYCADITPEDIRQLEEILNSTEDDSEYYKVPPLGRHYSLRWAQEDLQEEHKEGSRTAAVGSKKGVQGNPAEVESMLRRGEGGSGSAETGEDGCPFGPLTQRLVQALVEENIISPMDESPMPDPVSKAGGDEISATSPRSHGKPFSVSHARLLEQRVREELQAQGLLLGDGCRGEEAEDEVLAELKRRQAELRALVTQNCARKQELLRLAREEMQKQEVRRSVRAKDVEVLEVYRRIMQARQKKRMPSKKERDAAWRILRERENLLKQLET
uniref:transcriptional adapter 3 n=1 Tax=Myxine glutinosa TaxID=7769 RepID=UPI00358FDC7B